MKMEIKSISFRKTPAGRQHSACKTITGYYVGHTGLTVYSVSLPLTASTLPFEGAGDKVLKCAYVSVWKMSVWSPFMQSQLQHFKEKSYTYNGGRNVLDDLTRCRLKRNPRPGHETRSGFRYAPWTCSITCHFMPNLEQIGEKRRNL